MTLAPDKEGWVGQWSPGIGDPSVVGWLTVVLYFAAAVVGLLVARGIRRRETSTPASRRETWLWWLFFVLLTLLGVNKQLDLQTALTELGRILAHQEGWYAHRARVQKEFIAVLCAGAILAGVVLLVMLRRLGVHAKVAALGMCFIGAFVLIRASSFHHVDRFLSARLAHLRMNWILEIGGISVVLLAGLGRLRRLRGAATIPREVQPIR